jgi:hypothetical protein
VDSWGNLLVHEDQYPENISQHGPNELLLVHQDRTIDRVLVGLDIWGEPSGLEFSGDDDLFWVNWMGGANGSELIEVRCPPGWNAPPTGVPLPAPPAPALDFVAAPNPFGAATRLAAEVEPGRNVRLEIFDVRGAIWQTLVDGPLAGGRPTHLGTGGTRAGAPPRRPLPPACWRRTRPSRSCSSADQRAIASFITPGCPGREAGSRSPR